MKKDVVEAYKWFNLAAAQNNTNAAAVRDVLRKSLRTEQINDAQKRSMDFQNRQLGEN